jgi:hypothetical protein
MTTARKDTKAENGKGNVERRGKTWRARLSLPDGRRKRVPIPNSEHVSRAMAEEKAAVYSADVRRPVGDPRRLSFDVVPRGGKPLPVGASIRSAVCHEGRALARCRRPGE